MQATTGWYSEQIFYWLTKKSPQKIKCRFCEFKLFLSKKKFHETFHVFTIDKPFISKSGFSVLTPLSTKLQNNFRGLNPVKHLRWRVEKIVND